MVSGQVDGIRGGFGEDRDARVCLCCEEKETEGLAVWAPKGCIWPMACI